MSHRVEACHRLHRFHKSCPHLRDLWPDLCLLIFAHYLKLCFGFSYYKSARLKPEGTRLLGLIIIIVLLFLFLNPTLLPHAGTWLGNKSRKPFRQARWMWSSFSGTEDESIRAEQEYGRECARAFAKQFPGRISQKDDELVANIGSRLAAAVKDTRREFRFTVADSAIANAFALPGGFVFITGSLLDLCERSHDEIAFFLGHEIGHVLRGHAKDHLAADTFLKAVMSRLPAAGPMVRQVLSKGYSRTLELEADQEAVRLAAAAGFDARAAVHALRRLTRVASDSSGLAEYLSSHPPISERLRELEKSVDSD
jgi:beta-barrel assembly-enhancing protease